jgi:hypothetical protein
LVAGGIDVLDIHANMTTEHTYQNSLLNDLRPGEHMGGHHALTNADLDEIRRRRPGVRASFACEGIQFTAEDEALFEQFDRERLGADERAQRIIEISRAKQRIEVIDSA